MNIKVIGLNHKTAPIEIRERFFLTATQQSLLLSELKNQPEIYEAFVISTCNRTEVYIHTIDQADHMGFIVDLIAQIKEVRPAKQFRKYFYEYTQEGAVSHLLRVATGLDSLVLGEQQILRQVKNSVERARERATFGTYFNILSSVAIKAGKKAQTETEISCGGSSVSWAAVMMAEQTIGTFHDKVVLIIGAGKMGELSINQIHKRGAKKIYIMNRTEENARSLAERFGAVAVGFCDTKEILSEADVCICSAGAPHYILEKGTMEKIMGLRQNRSLALVDISVPRNIDPQVASIEGITLLMLDDLDKLVDEHMRKRQNAVGHVEKIITGKVEEFYRKIQNNERNHAIA